MELRKTTVKYYIDGTSSENPLLQTEMFECELPPEGRTFTYKGNSYRVIEVKQNYDTGTSTIYVEAL